MKLKLYVVSIAALAGTIFLTGCSYKQSSKPAMDHPQLAKQYFAEDADWYTNNIPFFECSDQQMEQVYYYRWKMYKAHIRNTGPGKFVITEFINHVAWDRDPECTINAASMHHIYEGRWLKDDRFMNGYIHYLYQDGGNNRRYSESVADAAYARFLVNSDTTFLVSQLDSMLYSYNQWTNNHWDSSKQLYYIPAMPDATEYTIASMDASNGKAGFDSGDAFRPTINSYMYANAMAISRTAALKGDTNTSNEYLQKATALKNNVEQYLWNSKLQHFTDRFKQNNQYVHYWDFIRGRELAGMIPWYFNLPSDKKEFNLAWKHVTDTGNLLGPYGLRTNEPSYEYYFKQIAYFEGTRSSQWNGPSWPYQTSQALTGMANMLNNYKQDVVITPADYIKLLRLYTQQHYLPDGKINLVENYDPNLGGPIVHCYWSNHYNHSSYNNLIITGLCGIHPSAEDTLDINPIVDNSIDWFYLDDVRYHGHKLAVVYDKDGSKYKTGKGLHVFVDDKKARLISREGKNYVVVGTSLKNPVSAAPVNLALNITRKGYPVPSASVNTNPDTSLYQAVDGRTWYFTEITNRWTTIGSAATADWYAVDFGAAKEISAVKLYFFADGKTYAVPGSISLEYKKGDQWLPLKISRQQPAALTGNTGNAFSIEKVNGTAVRINFKHNTKQVAVSEAEIY
jgi:hypothetical protein